MKTYEQIADNCKILWHEGFKLNNETHTQVSSYIFNEQNQLLIVKNGKTWTIPGGHPEENETPLDTLKREVMEESCITLKDVNYLGAVEVVEDGKTYYQLRYTAHVLKTLEFKQEWEISERLFVNLEDLQNYITWSNGITFSEQIKSAKKFWNI